MRIKNDMELKIISKKRLPPVRLELTAFRL